MSFGLKRKIDLHCMSYIINQSKAIPTPALIWFTVNHSKYYILF